MTTIDKQITAPLINQDEKQLSDGEQERDIYYMKQALLLSQETLERREVPIACVIVYKNNVIARGSNDVNRTKNATRHAEMLAIEQVREYATLHSLPREEVFSNSTLYVTTEPCVMCAAALRLVGLTDVAFGCTNQRFGGCGSRLDAHSRLPADVNTSSPDSKRIKLENGYDIDTTVNETCMVSMGPVLQCRSGIMADEAVDMLKMFYAGENPNAPKPKDKRGRREALHFKKESENN